MSFRFNNGSRGKHDLPEIMGGGVALFDADGDGTLDIYLCNGGPINASIGNGDSPCRLYRNRGAWHFEDITIQSGMPGPSYAMGAAVGDYDGDGRADLFVTGWRDQRLYRNLGGGRFLDVTQRAGLISSLWSTSAAFADLDGDGDLDLYVATYLEYDPESPPYCAAPDGQRDYCGPEDFPRSLIDFIATMATALFRISPVRLESTGPKAEVWASSSPSSQETTGPMSMSPTMERLAGCSPTKEISDLRKSPR